MSRARLLILLLASAVFAWALSVRLGIVLQIAGSPVPVSSGALSEHDLDELSHLPPEAQAARLIEKAINHYRGAAEAIDKRLDTWRGKMQPSRELENLTNTAYFSNDLRVRAMALEIWLARDNIQKSPDAVNQLIEEAGVRDGRQYFRLSTMGILGNRGVEPGRVLSTLLLYVHDPAGDTRAAAINGLGLLGTEGTVAPLLEVLRWDNSSDLRERAACNLGDSGMLTRQMRQTALPELIRFAQDQSLDSATRKWVFQALREIAGQSLPDDATAWVRWWSRRPVE